MGYNATVAVAELCQCYVTPAAVWRAPYNGRIEAMNGDEGLQYQINDFDRCALNLRSCGSTGGTQPDITGRGGWKIICPMRADWKTLSNVLSPAPQLQQRNVAQLRRLIGKITANQPFRQRINDDDWCAVHTRSHFSRCRCYRAASWGIVSPTQF